MARFGGHTGVIVRPYEECMASTAVKDGRIQFVLPHICCAYTVFYALSSLSSPLMQRAEVVRGVLKLLGLSHVQFVIVGSPEARGGFPPPDSSRVSIRTTLKLIIT